MAAHRYWRIYCTAANNGSAGLCELELRSSHNGSDLTGSGTSISSSGSCDNVFDDMNYSGSWNNGPPCWVGYDFGSGNSYDIVEFVITAKNDSWYNQSFRDFSLQYSDTVSYTHLTLPTKRIV